MPGLLETMLQAAVQYGGLQGFTLFVTSDGRWQAASSTDKLSWHVEIDDDFLAAVTRALSFQSAQHYEPDTQPDIFG